ncbi:sigma factor-like helix-turn-helix DNA-binding protein, partial [Mogibacterium timidum]
HTVDIDKLDEEQLIDDGVEATILSNEQTHELRYAIHNLDEPYKEVFMLRVYAEMHFRDIGTLFGKSDSWARVTYHRSRLKIIDDLEDKG